MTYSDIISLSPRFSFYYIFTICILILSNVQYDPHLIVI